MPRPSHCVLKSLRNSQNLVKPQSPSSALKRCVATRASEHSAKSHGYSAAYRETQKLMGRRHSTRPGRIARKRTNSRVARFPRHVPSKTTYARRHGCRTGRRGRAYFVNMRASKSQSSINPPWGPSTVERWPMFPAFQLAPVLDVPCVVSLGLGLQVGIIGFGEKTRHHCLVCRVQFKSA